MMVIGLFGNYESVPMHIGAFCTVGKGIQIRLQIYFAPHQILAAVDDHQQWSTGVTGARVTSTVEEVNEVTTTGELQPPPRNQEELHSPDGGSWGAWEATPESNATPDARTRARARQAVTEDEDAFLVYTGRGPPRLGELPRYASHKKLLVHTEFTHTDGEGYQTRFYDPEIATPHQIAELSRGFPMGYHRRINGAHHMRGQIPAPGGHIGHGPPDAVHGVGPDKLLYRLSLGSNLCDRG